jgi:hypothetical protein
MAAQLRLRRGGKTIKIWKIGEEEPHRVTAEHDMAECGNAWTIGNDIEIR